MLRQQTSAFPWSVILARRMRAPPYSPRDDELFRTGTIENPHPLFARLRREHPISRVADTGVHLVASWDLIDEALTRHHDFSANLTGVLARGDDAEPAVFPLPDSDATRVIATADEPDHSVHRALAQPRLTTSRMARLEGPLRTWTREAVVAWAAAGGGDFVPIAERIPASALARLLGLPDGDVSRHRRWAMMGGDLLAGDVNPAQMAELGGETLRMAEYLALHLERARAEVDAGGHEEADQSLLHALAAGVRDGHIQVGQAIGIAIVMFGAGGESTAAILGSAVRRLAEDPAVCDALRGEPGLIPRFVEEVARLEPPFKFHYRSVRRECELGGAELQPGDRLMLLWASANRDATHFEDPDTLRLDRRHPKQHMSFGRGSHFCIGVHLARLEARVVCEELLAHTRELSLGGAADTRYARSIFVRRLEHLPIQVRAAG
jgi:cytochrome P450